MPMYAVEWTERRAVSYKTKVVAEDACEALRAIRENAGRIRAYSKSPEEDTFIDVCIISVEEA